MRPFTHRHPASDTATRSGPSVPSRTGPGRPPTHGIAHVRQDNGELAEDVVQLAVVESTAIEEAGGVTDPVVDPGEDVDRILWIAPLPKEGDVPIEPTGQVGRADPGDRPDGG